MIFHIFQRIHTNVLMYWLGFVLDSFYILLVVTLGVACFVLFPFEDVCFKICFSVGSDQGQLRGSLTIPHSFFFAWYCSTLLEKTPRNEILHEAFSKFVTVLKLASGCLHLIYLIQVSQSTHIWEIWYQGLLLNRLFHRFRFCLWFYTLRRTGWARLS